MMNTDTKQDDNVLKAKTGVPHLLKEFGELKVSTRTIIASTGMQLDITKIFENMNVDSVENITKESKITGLKYRFVALYFKNEWKKVADWNPKYHSRSKSNNNKKKAPSNTETNHNNNNNEVKKSFRNALNLIYEIDGGNHVNFKISKNGKFQLTGCKEYSYAKTCVLDCVQQILTAIPNAILSPSIETLDREGISISFQTVMTNLDFHVGYMVNREILDNWINKKTSFYSLLETSFGYTGVNIKFPLSCEWWNVPCPVIYWNPRLDTMEDTVKPLIELIPSDVMTRYKKKGRYNTFLVFHSGKVIMSGMFLETMKADYNHFIQLMKEWEPTIKEKILV
jgi:TATA-box binding protein (TBP) (component of TFIID and TFIIIB)